MKPILTEDRLGGTVTIDINDFLDLKKFKETIENDGVYYEHFSYDGHTKIFNFYCSKDETISNLTTIIDNLNSEITDLKHPKLVIREPSIQEIKKMSIWQFLKWRKL